MFSRKNHAYNMVFYCVVHLINNVFHSGCFQILVYIYIYKSINRTTINLLLKVSRFFHDLQVNVLLTKIFLVLESFANYLQTSGNRIFFKYYYNRDFNRYKRYSE